jgi:hypothetical protein
LIPPDPGNWWDLWWNHLIPPYPTSGSTVVEVCGINEILLKRATKAAAPEPWIYSTTQARGVRAAAISHADDYNSSRECFRVHTYMDDFGAAVHVDTPDLQRVKLARGALAATGTEMNLPSGKRKWEEGEASQDQIALGIGFNTSDQGRERKTKTTATEAEDRGRKPKTSPTSRKENHEKGKT